MIEVHIFNAFLQPVIREADWFIFMNFINGMVAPSFIFISGFAFVISSENKINEMRSFGTLFRRKLLRIGQIFLVGYLIHIPSFSLRSLIFYTDKGMYKSFFNVDVLQCIGAGVFMLLVARMLAATVKVYTLFIAISAAGFVCLAPFVWKLDFNIFLPLPLACYFNEIHGSYFPVFPWLGFLFAGALFGLYIQNIREEGNENRFMARLALTGVLFIIFSFPILFWLKNYSWFEIKTAPLFFIQRLGVIFVLLYLFRQYDCFRGKMESFFFDIGRESLLVYWLHLVIIYRVLFNGQSMNNIINRSFGLAECIVATVIMVLLMLAVAIIWGRIKRHYPDSGRKIFVTLSISALIYFCLS
jgi:uncharacterized membrane protein